MKRYFIHIMLMLLVIFSACGEKKTDQNIPETGNELFSIRSFNALSNLSSDSILTMELDYLGVMNTGFIVPSSRQANEGCFITRFEIRNNGNTPRMFCYKIYYQNESYKFPETDVNGNMHEFAGENFYGSWSNTETEFKFTPVIPADGEFHVITDSIIIVGNPRNELRYFTGETNDRWKRNPRVGTYSFMLAGASEDALSQIPGYIRNISKTDNGRFISPYYYFLYGEGKKLTHATTVMSSSSLRLRAWPDLGAGIHINGGHFTNESYELSKTPSCYTRAGEASAVSFAQFIHYVDKSTAFENIPVIKDVLRDNYSLTEYNWNRAFYRRDELIATLPKVAEEPCKTVYSDPVNKKIVITNPATMPGKWRKENAGVITLHGFVYGKYRVKAKLTELLNRNNVWNGITNAIWLINQGGPGGWNMRRTCREDGYLENYWGGKDDRRVPNVQYSEIDFEILKTPAYCPEQSFPPVYKNPSKNPRDIDSWNVTMPPEVTSHAGDISVACTNWDMACPEPEDFDVGCHDIKYRNEIFSSHRWDHWYRAVTQKTYAPDDELFGGEYFYFEIDWRPEEIIWRIGPEPDRMRVVGYMNDRMTSVPNNQMCLIITQEFHNTKWWPGSPFDQAYIPFPANDIKGEILEVVIE